MHKLRRQEIFQKFDKIGFLIGHFQKLMFDEEYDEKQLFDALDLTSNEFPRESFSVMVLSENINQHSTNLTEKLKSLFEYLNVEKLIIISHLKLNFFGNLNHDFKKVTTAYSKLSKYFPEKTYKEAFEINTNEIDDFVEIFFWLERCDPSIPEYIYWFDEKEKFCFFFCKYGNLHFIDFTNGNLISDTQLEKLHFRINDYDQFEQNAIEGRKIEI